MNQLVIVAHDIRSAHNVGALLRTAEGFGIDMIYFTGYTPYPPLPDNDPRLPHQQRDILKKINKTALGAVENQAWQQRESLDGLLDDLQTAGFTIAALEQTANAQMLHKYTAPAKLAIVLGREVEGIESTVLARCDIALEIPMAGKKESFNVIQAAAVTMYHCRFIAHS